MFAHFNICFWYAALFSWGRIWEVKVKRSFSLKWNVSLFRGALHWDGSEGKKLGREHFYLWTIIIREGIELQYRKSPLPPNEGILLSLSPHPPTSHPPLKNLRVCHPCCTFSMQHITKISLMLNFWKFWAFIHETDPKGSTSTKCESCRSSLL